MFNLKTISAKKAGELINFFQFWTGLNLKQLFHNEEKSAHTVKCIATKI